MKNFDRGFAVRYSPNDLLVATRDFTLNLIKHCLARIRRLKRRTVDEDDLAHNFVDTYH